MKPLRTYDYLAQARGRVLDAVRPLAEAQYTRAFPIGPGSLARVFTHTLLSEWYYVQRMRRSDVPPYDRWEVRDESPLPFAALEAKWAEQARATRDAIRATHDWDAPVEYSVVNDEGKTIHVRTTVDDVFTQLVLHEVHHRAQALNILRQLGVTLGDIDFNALMYDRREVAP